MGSDPLSVGACDWPKAFGRRPSRASSAPDNFLRRHLSPDVAVAARPVMPMTACQPRPPAAAGGVDSDGSAAPLRGGTAAVRHEGPTGQAAGIGHLPSRVPAGTCLADRLTECITHRAARICCRSSRTSPISGKSALRISSIVCRRGSSGLAALARPSRALKVISSRSPAGRLTA